MIEELIKPVLDAHRELNLAILFGSQARGTAHAASDLDLAVRGEQPLSAAQKMGLVEELAAATGLPVDLIDLHTAGEPLLGEVLKHGRRLLGTDTAHAALLSKHLLDAADFLPYAQRLLAERRQAWIGS